MKERGSCPDCKLHCVSFGQCLANAYIVGPMFSPNEACYLGGSNVVGSHTLDW